ncbi:NitT/TauT family transport system ATP-binding protein [Oikeobacillus pervagus]|uniref:NitT/TauT family transport system ATP-binding protein n=1 Tax=Oikeobacillus pervagus TaxID=1325931 RepID=A0AAJ1SZM3_9BACI|nr:ABC transporter ATP-binding protein [Oikeobacillus pervagus]MDQ0215779.1 NitT/TauT family transport system ATP-binding protein [Oikeobacillus pervagus]
MGFVEIDSISHTYFTPTTANNALKNIHFTIEKGEFISLIGPSGCGKTTLLSIVAGLLSPTNGKILIEGKNPNQLKSLIGYMLQQDYLFPWKSIEENIFLGLKVMNLLNEETKQKAIHLLEVMGLQGVEKQSPRQLSGGMRQRVALVRTLAVNPKLLLLDEPFSALDYQTKLKLEDLVFTTLKSFHKTALLVTHDIGEAICMSDRIIMLSRSPGSIHRIFKVPKELRELSPFEARNHSQFPDFFQQIWKELELLEHK